MWSRLMVKNRFFGLLSLNWHPYVLLFSQSHVYTAKNISLFSLVICQLASLAPNFNSHVNMKLLALFRTMSGNSRRFVIKNSAVIKNIRKFHLPYHRQHSRGVFVVLFLKL
jgi:hypothetical protein